MANLICALDPLCEIYVARVAEDAFGIKADNVAKVSKCRFWRPTEGVKGGRSVLTPFIGRQLSGPSTKRSISSP